MKLFLSAVICSVALGIFLRAWFAGLPLEQLLQQKLLSEWPDAELKLNRTYISLAQGWLPELALRLENVVVKKPGPCRESKTIINISNLSLPLSISSLWRGEWHWGALSADGIRFELADPNVCGGSPIPQRSAGEAEAAKSKAAGEGEMSTAALIPLKVGFTQLRRMLNDLQNHSRISGISSRQLEIVWWQNGKSYNVRIPYFDLRGFDGPQNVRLRGNVEVPAWVGLVRDLPRLSFSGEVGDNFADFNLQGYWREGSIRSEVKWTANDQISLSGSLKHLPLFEVGEVYEKLAQLKGDVHPRLAWISCDARLSSSLKEINNSELIFEPCQIEGSLGRVLFPQIRLSFIPRLELAPFTAQLSEVSMDGLLQLFSIPSPRGIFAHLGQVDGRLFVNSQKSIEFDGVVFDPEIIFSNLGHRLRQKIEEMKVEIKMAEGRVKGHLSDLVLKNGSLQGDTSFDLQEDFSDGNFSVNINTVKLSPDVMELMFGGNLDGLKLNGNGKVKDQHLASWDGELSAQAIQRHDLSGENLRVKSHFGDRGLVLKLSIDKLSQLQDLEWLQPLIESLHPKSENVAFKRLTAEVVTSPERVYWNKMSVLAPDGSHITSRGGWTSNDELMGWVSLERNSFARRWQLRGSRLTPKLVESKESLANLGKWEPDAPRIDSNGATSIRVPSTPSLPRKILTQLREVLRRSAEK